MGAPTHKKSKNVKRQQPKKDDKAAKETKKEKAK
jgi:hypothetical protein